LIDQTILDVPAQLLTRRGRIDAIQPPILGVREEVVVT